MASTFTEAQYQEVEAEYKRLKRAYVEAYTYAIEVKALALETGDAEWVSEFEDAKTKANQAAEAAERYRDRVFIPLKQRMVELSLRFR